MPFSNLSLRIRIFLSMLLLVLIASIFIATLTIYQNKEQGQEYHQNRLLRKESIIKSTIENELKKSTFQISTEFLPFIFRDEIYQISDIHKLDINMYDLKGKLLISSVPSSSKDTTNYNLSKQIVSHVENNLEHRFIKNKQINNKNVKSSFTYIIDAKFKPIGILGLPYLQDNTEQKRELKEFLERLIFSYIIIFLIAIAIAYWLSSYITKSIKTVADKISKTVLGTRNEKIEIDHASKEIATLLDAYNGMIDELEVSAVKLAKSEREEAWREMAKQVAHEIKNPLTPMRLTVQNFQRKFNPNDPDYKEKLSEFTKSIILQIDTLTTIASAFSNFAKMPSQNKESLNVVEVVRHALEIFSETYIEYQPSQTEIVAQLDKIQLTRIVTNLVKNATQALKDTEHPSIKVNVLKEQNNVIIKVIDNGKGIANEHKNHIFEPKFTTKSSGMGLGLPMVKNIIEAYKGTLVFTSEINKETIFTVTLPSE
jgi:signal transduction histidine kinase